MKRAKTRIEGKRLLLQKLRLRDMWTIGRLLRDKEISRFHLMTDYDLRHSNTVRKLTRVFFLVLNCLGVFWWKISLRVRRSKYKLGIVNKETGQLIGGVTLSDAGEEEKCASIGFWLGKPFWG